MQTNTILNKEWGFLQLIDVKYFHLTLEWKNPIGIGAHIGFGKSVLFLANLFNFGIMITIGKISR